MGRLRGTRAIRERHGRLATFFQKITTPPYRATGLSAQTEHRADIIAERLLKNKFCAVKKHMDVKIDLSWKEKVGDEFTKPYFTELAAFVKKEYQNEAVYPPPKYMFRAFDLCPFDKVKVVILGQDPYHGPRQANGLCFAVDEGTPLPPSLQNIYKELSEEHYFGHAVS